MAVLLTPAEEELYSSALDYGQRYFKPFAGEWDLNEAFPLTAFRQAGSDGYLGLGISCKNGGRGLGFLQSALVYQGLARSCFPLSFAMACHNNMSYEMEVYETSPGVKALLPDFCSGKEIQAFALTEEQAGSDPLSSSAYAEKCEGGWIVNGKKTWCTNGGVATRIYLTVKERSSESRTMLSFLADIPAEGVRIAGSRKTLGARLLSMVDLEFDDCFIPESRVISRDGYKDALWAVQIGRIFVAANAVGLAEEALDVTGRFLAGRVQFGKEILRNQGIQWELAELTARLEAAKWLVYRTASMMDTGEAPVHESSMAKLVCGDLAVEITSRCAQFWGARGFSRGEEIERYCRESRMLPIIDGTAEIQKLILGKHIANKYLKR